MFDDEGLEGDWGGDCRLANVIVDEQMQTVAGCFGLIRHELVGRASGVYTFSASTVRGTLTFRQVDKDKLLFFGQLFSAPDEPATKVKGQGGGGVIYFLFVNSHRGKKI